MSSASTPILLRLAAILAWPCLIGAVTAGAQDIQFGKVFSDSISMASANVETAEFRVIETAISRTNAAAVRGHLYCVYEPVSGRFWWTFGQESRDETVERAAMRFLENYRIVKADQSLIGFTARGRNLWTRKLDVKAATLDGGIESAATQLAEEFERSQTGASSWFQPINLSSVLGLEFFRSKQFREMPRGMELLAVKPADSGWEITLRGEDDQTVAVRLDSSLQKVTRIGGAR